MFTEHPCSSQSTVFCFLNFISSDILYMLVFAVIAQCSSKLSQATADVGPLRPAFSASSSSVQSHRVTTENTGMGRVCWQVAAVSLCRSIHH